MTNPNEGSAADTDGKSLLSKPTAIEGTASVTTAPAVLPVGKAVWVVNAEAKNALSTFLGGCGVITRREDTGKFHGEFTIAALDDGGGQIDLSVPLHDCVNLVEAEAHFEARVRESLAKTHADLHADLTAGEHQEAVAAAGPDPF